MKKLIKRLLVLVITLSICGYTMLDVNASGAETIAELKKEINELKQKKANSDNKKYQTQSEINASSQSINNAKTEINNNQEKIDKAKKDIKKLNKEIKTTKENMKETLKAYQITDGQNIYLEYIFEAKDYEDFVYRYAIAEQIIEYNNNQIDEYNNLIEKNKKLQKDLAKRETELNNQIEQLSEKIDDLGTKLEEYAEITMDIQDEIDSQNELLKYYEKLGCGENEKITACESRLNDSIVSASGFRNPMTKGVVTSNYGYRINPLTGTGSKFHSGIDIGGNSEGTSIYATANGKVGKVIYKASCGGNQVHIYHTVNGVKYTSSYLHLLTINVSTGQTVTSNTVVGTVGGGSGTRSWDYCSTGPHLHFGLAYGWYGGTGSNSYSSYSTYLAKTFNPRNVIGFPNSGYWYSR